MLKNLINDYLNEFVMKRTEEIGRNILVQHPEYDQLSNELISIFKKLLENLPENCKKNLYCYEEKENQQEAIAVQIMYKQGFTDGINLGRELFLSKQERK